VTAALRAADLGQIRTKDGRVYQITPEDALWLARAVKYEGGDPAATAWTYAQRWALKRWSGTLASLVRAHSQPINPAWDEASDPNCVNNPDRCTSAALARRHDAATAMWSELGGAADVVLAFAQARLPNPAPRATDFADAIVSRGFLTRNPGARVVLERGNWYIAEVGALDWPTNFVEVVFRGATSGASASWTWLPWAVGAGAIAAGVGFALSRSR